jgi:hypothetical protein
MTYEKHLHINFKTDRITSILHIDFKTKTE